MIKTNLLIIGIVSLFLFSNCEFIRLQSEFKKQSNEFLENLKTQNLDNCATYLTTDSLNIDIKKRELQNLSDQLKTEFKSDFNFSYEQSKNKSNSNFTNVYYQISNKKHCGEIELVFNNDSKKITDFKIIGSKRTIPSMVMFWIFAICSLLIPIFIIYVITLIRKSSEKQKWIKYLTVIAINLSTINYNAFDGFSYKLMSAQFFFGVGFTYSGFLNSVWSLAIPIGAIYWFWKLRIHKIIN